MTDTATLQQQIIQLQQELASTQSERDNLRLSLSEMSDNFEQLIAKQTQALKQARDMALSASKTKSEFLANMSHEIRTPLTAIIGFSNSLTDETLSERDFTLATAAITRNSHHLMEIISDILDLSKIEHDQFELEQVDFDLFSLLHDVEETVSAQAMEKNLWLNVNIQFPTPQIICADPTWVKQVLLNLCSNAIKFTKKGGVDINVSYVASNNKIAVDVIDTGIGMNAHQQGKVFEPFSQADTTTTRRYGGTGLGLTICANLVKLMQGELYVTSGLGKGSRFSFDFAIAPLKPGAIVHFPHQLLVTEQGDEEVQSIPNLSGHILVAEDSIDTQNLVSLYIRKTGAQATFVNNGQIAVEKALAHNYDLVLMDIQMPLVSGIEATQILRQVGFAKPIVAFTANAIKQELESALDAGCNDHITKPIDKAAFYQILSQHLPKSNTSVTDTKNDDLFDDEEFNAIRGNFIRRTPILMAELRQTIDNKDWSHAKVLVHTFKGTCGSLGFKHLFTLSKQLEDGVNNPDITQQQSITSLLGALQQEIEAQSKPYDKR